MNIEQENPGNLQKAKVKSRTDYLRVGRETKKKILTELSNINRKNLGKPITPDQYVALAISLINPEHLEKLKEQSLSNKDRLEMRYQEYCEQHGKISKDEYLGILLSKQN